MLFKQRSYWYFYDSRLDILFFSCVTISCVHPSLWIDIIMIFIYLESYTLERSYIFNGYPNSFTSTFSFSVYFLGGSVKGFVLSADLISLHLFALFCGEDCFPLACLDEAFAMSIGINNWYQQLVSLLLMKLSFSLFTMGCHKLCS